MYETWIDFMSAYAIHIDYKSWTNGRFWRFSQEANTKYNKVIVILARDSYMGLTLLLGMYVMEIHEKSDTWINKVE